jgi:hypothetical protein
MMTMPADIAHEPTLRGVTLPDEGGRPPVEVQAYLLGYASSQHDTHDENAHDPGETAPKRVRCSACRWFEVQIYDVSDDPNSDETYLVYTVGKTIVPDETDRIRFVWTTSEYEVVEALVVRQGGVPKMPVASGRALAQAAKLDEDIAHAYINRAVA